MIIQTLSCPHCGASIECNPRDRSTIHCIFCGGSIFVDDGTVRSEHKETTQHTVTVDTNVNKASVKRYVNEAELQKAKNAKTTIWVTAACFLLFVVFIVSAVAFGYHRGSTNVSIANSPLEAVFKKAVLGKASMKSHLIVLEQEVSVDSTLKKEGLFDWGIFGKNKEITYVGKAVYALNFRYVKENDVIVDTERKTVTIYIPKPEMYELVMDPNEFRLGDTNKGWLAFGDIKLTLEEAFFIEKEAFKELKAKATEEDIFEQATQHAETQVAEYFKSTIISVDPNYKLIINIY